MELVEALGRVNELVETNRRLDQGEPQRCAAPGSKRAPGIVARVQHAGPRAKRSPKFGSSGLTTDGGGRQAPSGGLAHQEWGGSLTPALFRRPAGRSGKSEGLGIPAGAAAGGTAGAHPTAGGEEDGCPAAAGRDHQVSPDVLGGRGSSLAAFASLPPSRCFQPWLPRFRPLHHLWMGLGSVFSLISPGDYLPSLPL